jgi:predicted kinase
MNRNLYILIGPPAVGKSTWRNNNIKDPYVISRDDVVDMVAEANGLTYDDLFKSEHRALNGRVNSILRDRIDFVKKSYDENIVIDMTNMSIKSRRKGFDAIKGVEEDFRKIAVVFNFKNDMDVIKKIAKKRSEELEKQGIKKSIPEHVFDSMLKRYEDVTLDEGFDEIIEVDTIDDLKSCL